MGCDYQIEVGAYSIIQTDAQHPVLTNKLFAFENYV